MVEEQTMLNHYDGLFNYEGENVNFFPSIGLKLTNSCNYNCPFCCEPDKDRKLFPINNFKEITIKLRKYGTKRLCLTGGDPLLYPDIGQLLDHNKSLGFYNLLLTTNGSLLETKYMEVSPFINAVRFSVHAMTSKHNDIVGHSGAFDATSHAIDLLTKNNISCFVATVVTPLNVNDISDIAEWSFSKGITRYYLFALMKSGHGKRFIEANGAVPLEQISVILARLKSKYHNSKMEIIYYDYSHNAECILIYGDGKIVIDPYHKSSTFQLEIGNIFTDSQELIIEKFLNDKDNLDGHRIHLNKHKKKYF